jgi:hypothetical protein
MADIRCLICNRVNDVSAERCWYCNTLLPRQTGSLTPQEREKLAGIRGQSFAPEDESLPQPAEGTPPTAPPEPAKQEIPEWLERVRQLKQQDDQVEKPEHRDWVAEEQPDWLRDLTGDKHEQADQVSGAAGEEPGDEGMDLESKPIDQIEPHDEDLSEPDFEHAASVEQTPFKGDIYAFENSLEPEPDRAAEPALPSAVDEFAESEDDAIARQELADIIPAAETDSSAEFPIAVEDLPDWLAEEQPASETQETLITAETQPEPSPEKRIEKAHLPAWLASLRPVQPVSQSASAAEPEIEPEVEDHGILAGIKGTLPGSRAPQQAKESKAFSSDLHLSPAQRRNVDLLRLLLQPDEDDHPERVEKQKGGGKHNLLRIVVTLIVLLSVLFPIFTPDMHGVIPALYSTEVVDTLSIIQSLPEDKPVLITAHFEPGLAGELSWTAEPVLRHLVARGVPLALSSTNVSGFAILKKMVSDAVAEGADYALNNKVVDLGYLPGSSIGLGALVSDPLAALPFTTDIQPVAELNVLKGVHTLSDFGALILVTDNPDIARSWIEQIERNDLQVITLVVVSAQAAPLVQPYYTSAQVDGIVSGVAGALSYELLRAVPGVASSKFNIYQVALLSAAVLILAGGIISAFIGSSNSAAKEGKS